MKDTLFYNGQIHTMVSEEDIKSWMLVRGGRIAETGTFDGETDGLPEKFGADTSIEKIDLKGQHVYPCLIDGHTHMLLTIAVMAMGFNACEITADGVEPHTIDGVAARVREYASKQKKNAIIAINNYILTAIDERRMPTKDELDEWGNGRAVVIYNIDGHSTALSSKMLEMVGIDPLTSNGVLQGEANERAQGRIIDTVGSSVGLSALARGIANFHNYCAEYGIGIVGALEGNGDSVKDSTTKLIIKLARHFDVGVRLYLQYRDPDRVKPFEKLMKNKRAGGCGDWEMDGASGSHSAAFSLAYKDTGKEAPCYYTQAEADAMVKSFAENGYQIASHAIGDLAINRIIESLGKFGGNKMHRIEHCEFHDDDAFKELAKGRYAVMMQPGYAWIDKRYLHTYEQYIPEEIRLRMKLKSLFDAGICVCGSSDSPVQDMDPYLQMLGMTEFYVPEESVSAFTAMKSYTVNAAKALLEDDDYGTLEAGKIADFFTADKDFFDLQPSEITGFRPNVTYYGGKAYRKKSGSLPELLWMMLKKPHLI